MTLGKALVIGFTVFMPAFAGAQSDSPEFRKKFQEAEDLIGVENYEKALPLFLQLIEMDPTNANVNFKIGVCLFNSFTFNFPVDQEKSLRYFSNSLTSTTDQYKTGTYKERNAPVDAYFYLAEAYHFLHRIDSAEYYYKAFRERIKDKNSGLVLEVEHRLAQCANARKLMANPLPVFITNLGSRINSAYNDYAPVISADESTLIFTSRRPGSTGEEVAEDGQYFEDIYISENIDRVWSNPVSIGTTINTEYHEASISLSPDGKSLFIFKANGEDGNIFMSTRIGDTWSEPEKLGAHINSPAYEAHASMTDDGKTLYFSSERAGGKGKLDIYMSTLQEDDTWGPATNLGDAINTEFDEDSPFIHPDGKTLYFSSKGHMGMGGMDIFKSVKQDDGTWGKAENMGYPINSAADNIYWVVNRNNTHAYFSSVRENGYGGLDVFRIVLGNDEEEEEEMVEEVVPVKDTVAILEPEIPEKKEAPFELEILYFEYNVGKLNVESVDKVKRMKDILAEHKDIKVEISGHTDDVGGDEFNLFLSRTRAQSVFEYFVRNGIDKDRMTVVGKGETQPLKPNTSKENQALNRRVEIRVIK